MRIYVPGDFRNEVSPDFMLVCPRCGNARYFSVIGNRKMIVSFKGNKITISPLKSDELFIRDCFDNELEIHCAQCGSSPVDMSYISELHNNCPGCPICGPSDPYEICSKCVQKKHDPDCSYCPYLYSRIEYGIDLKSLGAPYDNFIVYKNPMQSEMFEYVTKKSPKKGRDYIDGDKFEYLDDVLNGKFLLEEEQ